MIFESHPLIYFPGLMWGFFYPCRCCWWCQKSSAATTQPFSCFHENRVGHMIVQRKGNQTQSIAYTFFVHSDLSIDYKMILLLPHCSNCVYQRIFVVWWNISPNFRIAEYHLNQYESAHAAFTQAHQQDGECGFDFHSKVSFIILF